MGGDEVWKAIKGFEGMYEVSNYGRIRGLPRKVCYKDGRVAVLRGGLLKGTLGLHGYRTITLGSKTRRSIHRLVAEAFLGEKETRETVNHKDGNKLNNFVENLEWATYKENNRHARNNGFNRQHGVNVNLAKYSDDFINAVRNVHGKYKPSFAELAEVFSISNSHARDIVNMRTRKRTSV